MKSEDSELKTQNKRVDALKSREAVRIVPTAGFSVARFPELNYDASIIRNM